MPTYQVECYGEAREVYIVTADTIEEARDNWHTGYLMISEASGMDPVGVLEVEE